MAELAVSALFSLAGDAALGAGFYGVSGAAIGWAVGSYVGHALLAPAQEGPKLTDKKVQISSYGAPIPLAYGGIRLAGNVIWSTDLVEHKRTSGGKGGSKVTKYTYTVSCATMICANEITSIRRIWADSKIVWDASDTAAEKTLAASAKFAKYFTLYSGTEAQLPDPTMEAVDGAGNVPAYRGYAYVVFNNLPLDDYGNRIPSFSFELSTGIPTNYLIYPRSPLIVGPWKLLEDGRPVHSLTRNKFSATTREFSGSGAGGPWADYATALSQNNIYLSANAQLGSTHGVLASTNFFGYYTATNSKISKFSGGAQVALKTLAGSDEWIDTRTAYSLPDIYNEVSHVGLGLWIYDLQGVGATVSDGKTYYTYDCERYPNTGGVFVIKLVPAEPPPFPANFAGINNATNYPIGPNALYPVAVGNSAPLLRVYRQPSLPPQTCEAGANPCTDGLAQIPDESNFCISCDGQVSFNNTWSLATGTAQQLCNVEYRSGLFYQQALGPVVLSTDPNYGDATFWANARAAAIANGTLLNDIGITTPVSVTEWAEAVPPNVVQVPGGYIALSTIVSDLCVRSGLQTSQIDVTELTDIVLGYAMTRQGNARNAIDPLRQAYFFDPVESGIVIKFIKRGHNPVATIDYTELGASDNGDAEPIAHERAQETEIPATLNFTYGSRVADYATGTQIARRQVTVSKQEATVDSAIVMGDTKALAVANGLLYDLWASRTSRVIQVLKKHANIEPTDVITINSLEATYRVRVVDKTEQGGWIKLDCKDEDQAAWKPEISETDNPANVIAASNPGTPTAPPATVAPVTPPPRFDGPMKSELLDLPLLQEHDTNPGYYVAASGYTKDWRGGFLFRSDDAGATYNQKLEVTKIASMGYAQNALGTYLGGNTVDELNSITVKMHTGTWSSITRAQLLNPGNLNALAIGAGNQFEIIQAQHATLVSAGIYRLSGLLRGRLGTERFMTTHAVNDLVVTLDPASIYRIADTIPSLGMAELYKGVTYGDTVEAATAIPFTNSGISMRALPPSHLAGASIGGGLYRINWKRRARYAAEWIDFADVPLDMGSESYFVYVRRAGVGVGRKTVFGATTCDLAALSGDIIEVSQISDRVGLGLVASITLG